MSNLSRTKLIISIFSGVMGLVGSGVGIACEAGVKSTGRTKWLKGPEEVTSTVDDKSQSEVIEN